MKSLSEYPRFRQDIEIVAQASPGKPNRHVLRDPTADQFIEVTDKEAFLCRQLDGVTPLAEIQARFMDRYGLLLRLDYLRDFVTQLADNGFIAGVQAAPTDSIWQKMKPLPLAGELWISRFDHWFGWCFTWPAYAVFAVLILLQIVILGVNWNMIWYQIQNFIQSIQVTGQNNAPSSQLMFRVAVVLVVMPFFCEIVKGIFCRRMGATVPEVRYMWYMRFIPRCGSDIAAIGRIDEKKDRLHVAVAGMVFQLMVMAIASTFTELLTNSNPAHDVAFSIALGSAIGFVLNLCPLGKVDGSLFLSLALEIPDFRARAVRVFRAALFRSPRPEPLSPRDYARFFWYGMLADAYTVAINVLLFWLVGYLLIHWVQGLGATIFVVLVVLRFEDDIKKVIMSSPLPRSLNSILPKNSSHRGWLIWGIVAVVLILLFVIPYPYEISGEFRVQADSKREVRADVQSQIESMPVKEGQEVKAGQLLVKLDDRLIQHNLDAALASLDKARQDLKLFEAGSKPEDIAKAEQAVKLAAAGYVHAENTCKRAEELHGRGDISDQQYEDALKERDLSRENLELARRELDVVKSGTRPETIDGQKDVIRSLEVTVDKLNGDLERTTINSPIDGYVTTLYLTGKIGQLVNPGDVLAIVEDNRKVTVRIALPEQYASQVKMSARVRAKPWAYSTTILKGQVTSINQTVMEKTEDILKQDAIEQEKGATRNLNMPGDNVVIVLAELDNSGGLLRTEMTGFAKIDAPATPLGLALLDPVLRFFRVRVWSWLP